MKIPRRRRLEKKTDYKSRFNLLKSNEKRLIIRRTNKYLIAQIVETEVSQDKVLLGLTSRILMNFGWPKEKLGSLKNLSAAYLTGFALGNLAQKKNIKKVILDIGMHRNIHKSRIYAVLKGALDAGMIITHNPDALPTVERLEKNKELNEILTKLKEKI